MATTAITPRKSLKKTAFVTIPRKEYEELLRVKNQNQAAIVVKRSPLLFPVAKKHEKFYNEVDKSLTEALAEVRAGKCYGPFDTTDELFKFLNRER